MWIADKVASRPTITCIVPTSVMDNLNSPQLCPFKAMKPFARNSLRDRGRNLDYCRMATTIGEPLTFVTTQNEPCGIGDACRLEYNEITWTNNTETSSKQRDSSDRIWSCFKISGFSKIWRCCASIAWRNIQFLCTQALFSSLFTKWQFLSWGFAMIALRHRQTHHACIYCKNTIWVLWLIQACTRGGLTSSSRPSLSRDWMDLLYEKSPVLLQYEKASIQDAVHHLGCIR